jgi:hypothetical protein
MLPGVRKFDYLARRQAKGGTHTIKNEKTIKRRVSRR